MGTHPIFESDFDCLTDWKCRTLDFLCFFFRSSLSQQLTPGRFNLNAHPMAKAYTASLTRDLSKMEMAQVRSPRETQICTNYSKTHRTVSSQLFLHHQKRSE